MTRLTKEQKNGYKQFIIDSIVMDDPDQDYSNEEKLQFLFQMFESEKSWFLKPENMRRLNTRYQQVLIDWLQGPPSHLKIPFRYCEQLELAKKYGSLPENPTEKQEGKIIENYYPFMSNLILQLGKQYKLKSEYYIF